jgi:hypothetical protein
MSSMFWSARLAAPFILHPISHQSSYACPPFSWSLTATDHSIPSSIAISLTITACEGPHPIPSSPAINPLLIIILAKDHDLSLALDNQTSTARADSNLSYRQLSSKKQLLAESCFYHEASFESVEIETSISQSWAVLSAIDAPAHPTDNTEHSPA